MTEVPAVAGIQERWGAENLNVLVLDVDPGEGLTGLRQMKELAGNPSSVAFALDTGNRVTSQYRVRSLGAKRFIDRDGKLFAEVDGPMDGESLRALSEKLVRAGT